MHVRKKRSSLLQGTAIYKKISFIRLDAGVRTRRVCSAYLRLKLSELKKSISSTSNEAHSEEEGTEFKPSVVENASVIEFLYRINLFFISILFYKFNSNNRIKRLIQLSEPNFNFNSTFKSIILELSQLAKQLKMEK
jgi:hypothetical protein